MKKTGIMLCLALTLGASACSKSNGNDIDVRTDVNVQVDPDVTVDPNITEEPAESEKIELRITKIGDGYFLATDYFPSPVTYNVIGTLDKDYCVDDYVNVTYDKMTKTDEDNYEIVALTITASDYQPDPDSELKPVIYLYPEETTKVHVDLDYNGKLLVTEPAYQNGWTVTAKPDGTLVDESDHRYPYLFWEGKSDIEYDMSKGFCIAGEKTKEFLDEKLAFMGLNEKEMKEFEEFWVPVMQDNPYNLITFQTTQYTDNAKLHITPKPDSMLRIFMVFQPLNEYKTVEEPELHTFTRNGFTVVEWGGRYSKTER